QSSNSAKRWILFLHLWCAFTRAIWLRHVLLLNSIDTSNSDAALYRNPTPGPSRGIFSWKVFQYLEPHPSPSPRRGKIFLWCRSEAAAPKKSDLYLNK